MDQRADATDKEQQPSHQTDDCSLCRTDQRAIAGDNKHHQFNLISVWQSSSALQQTS